MAIRHFQAPSLVLEDPLCRDLLLLLHHLPTFARSVQRLHIEDIHALHLPQDLQALQARRLLDIRGHGADRAAGGQEVAFRLHVCGGPWL